MATGKRLVFHVVALVHHMVTLGILARVDWASVNNEKLMHIQEFSARFFTTWNFTFQLIFLICAVICDVGDIQPELADGLWPQHEVMKKCARARDFLYTTVVFPCTTMVAVLFWAVYHYDRELVMPAEVDLVLPAFVNHSMHSIIVLVVLLELLLGEKRPRSRPAAGAFWLGTLILTYYVVFFATYYSTGRWIYKIFNIWNWTERVIFLILNIACLYVLFFFGAHAEELVHQYRKIKDDKMAERENQISKSGKNGEINGNVCTGTEKNKCCDTNGIISNGDLKLRTLKNGDVHNEKKCELDASLFSTTNNDLRNANKIIEGHLD